MRWTLRKILVVTALLATALGCVSTVIAPRLMVKQGVREKEPRIIQGLIGGTEYSRGRVEVTRYGPAWDTYLGVVDVPDESRAGLTADAWFEMFARDAAAPPTGIWSNRSHVIVRVVDYGWPLRCFDTVLIHRSVDPTFRIPPAGSMESLRGGPLVLGVGHIRWRPFVANAALFAAAWGASLLGVSTLWLTLRRRSRRRAGRCLACGYNRAGIATEAVCPECGKLP